ncbi:hypothetical protein [Sphingobium sp. Sx8-8]|uniref:hypothetical protein n=1 Tax=Sphingobium sp. Sx8-8 TaxID=2933617 RepID=UPI001F5A960F|nr:hypothetical protein [Sphingobium sp. Sx8-8]
MPDLYASDGPSDTVWLDIAELKDMLRDANPSRTCAADMVRDKLREADPDEIDQRDGVPAAAQELEASAKGGARRYGGTRPMKMSTTSPL